MYSCVNYPRGCRGRVNVEGTKCANCVSLNLRRPGTSSPFTSALRGTHAYKRPWELEASTTSKTVEKF